MSTDATFAADAAPNTAEQPPAKKKIPYLPLGELKASLASFSAILPPVFLTMVISAFITLFVIQESGELLQNDNILLFNEDEATSQGEAVANGLTNALVIIGVIGLMTFLIVLIIYCEKEWLFQAYIFFAMLMLMGFTTGFMVIISFQDLGLNSDIVSMSIFFVNYAVVGAIAVFSYEGGFQGKDRLIPYWVTQMYLVFISVVMAWLVTNMLPRFTTWALLILLAMYDLCAVLTPCGPLALLIKVVTQRMEKKEQAAREKGEELDGDQGQMIPGLLYEVNTGRSTGLKRYQEQARARAEGRSAAGSTYATSRATETTREKPAPSMQSLPTNAAATETNPTKKEEETENVRDEVDADIEDLNATEQATETEAPRAIPKDADVDVEAPKDASTEEATTEAQAEVPPVETSTPVIPPSETVVQEVIAAPKQKPAKSRKQIEDDYEYGGSNLKLGLGDFVFYSVLTSIAAEFGFVAFISVAVVVMCGLCGTLVLLNVFEKALPALPISIILGIIAYLVVNNFTSGFADGLAINLVTV